jgi:DNA uptake protein ComE-like DNA-binding protein
MRTATQVWKIRTAIVLVSVILWSVLAWRILRDKPREPESVSARIAVEVKGDVPAPGTYLLESERATVSHAISASRWSGAFTGVDRKLEPGESLTVMPRGSQPEIAVGRMSAAAALAAGLKIDLNCATVEDLLLIPKMRPDIAEAIVKRRDEKAWEHVGELLEVPGIGPKTIRRFEDFLRVAPPARDK